MTDQKHRCACVAVCVHDHVGAQSYVITMSVQFYRSECMIDRIMRRNRDDYSIYLPSTKQLKHNNSSCNKQGTEEIHRTRMHMYFLQNGFNFNTTLPKPVINSLPTNVLLCLLAGMCRYGLQLIIPHATCMLTNIIVHQQDSY